MRGTVKFEGGSWYYRVYVGVDPLTLKKKYKKKRGFKVRKDAEAALAKAIVEITNGTLIDNENMTLIEYLDYWKKQYVDKNCAASTIKRYEYSIQDVKTYLGNIKLNKVNPLLIQEFYDDIMDDKKICTNTLLKTHRTLHLALKQAVQWRLMQSNPCDYVIKPKENKVDVKYWSFEKVDDFLIKLKDEFLYGPTFVALHTGLRVGEICALKWKDINFESATMNVSKNMSRDKEGELGRNKTKTSNSVRSITLFSSTIKYLKSIKTNNKVVSLNDPNNYESYIFHWEDGRPLDPHYVSQKFPEMLERHKIGIEDNMDKITFHGLRHTHATMLLAAGIKDKVISERLGHSTVAFTLDVYSHVNDELQKKEMEKAREMFENVSKI